MSAPEVKRVLETALYVDDVSRSLSFYRDLFEFEVLFESERAAGLNVAGGQVLLLFKKGGTPEDLVSERGVIPAHDGDGRLHVALAIDEDMLRPWEERLEACEVPVEARYQWERGGRSVYFRDPDGHLIEFVTPGCWPIY